MRPIFVSCAIAAMMTGCAVHGEFPNPGIPDGSGIVPQVVQKGGGAQWVTLMPKTLGGPWGPIVNGLDGNMWFVDELAGQIVRISMTGASKEFALGGLAGSAVALTLGADGKFYISHEAADIVRVTKSGAASSLPIPSGDSTSIDSNGLGPDGNVWFTEFHHIGRVTPAGVISEFAYPNQTNPNQYGGVTAGPDGNVWFSESSNNVIGRIIPATGKIKEFTIPQACIPAPIVTAKDHAMWFTCLTSAPIVGRITTSGTIKMFLGGGAFNSNETEQFGAVGPDGNPWFASGTNNVVFSVDTTTHKVTTFTPPLAGGERPNALQTGPDGNIWVTTVGGNHIYVLVMHPLSVSPVKLTFTGIGQTKTATVAQSGTPGWTATSSNTAVATVKQGTTKSKFDVKSVGAGSCRVTIADAIGNSVVVKVTVP